MAAISQFYVLSPRGDTIISKQYRGDIVRGTAEMFFRKMKFWATGQAPPVFLMDGINFLYVRKNGLYFVATTKFNVSPSLFIDIVNRLTRLFKDYCGILNEESIRKNFILIYELLDEVMDYGVPQDMSTHHLKSYVHNEPVSVVDVKAGGMASKFPSLGAKTKSSSAVHAPISVGMSKQKTKKNEIFVDILERLSVTFNSTGTVLNAAIDGCIQMKSYLSGNPPLRLALNEDLVVGKGGATRGQSCVLDDCNFHRCVQLNEFEGQRILNFVPPEGEFVVMNYRVTSAFRSPFRVMPVLEEKASHRMEMRLQIRADIPADNYGANVRAEFSLPQTTATCTTHLPPDAQGEASEYQGATKKVVWRVKKCVAAPNRRGQQCCSLLPPVAGVPSRASRALAPRRVHPSHSPCARTPTDAHPPSTAFSLPSRIGCSPRSAALPLLRTGSWVQRSTSCTFASLSPKHAPRRRTARSAPSC
jgi:AP-4 complex subunit mu-1